MALPIDPERFLALVAALATTHCASASPAPQPGRVALPTVAVRTTIEAAPETSDDEPAPDGGAPAPAPEPAPDDPRCGADAGEVQCDWAAPLNGPTCEGIIGACELLPTTYSRPVAAAASRCLAGIGRRACTPGGRSDCVRQAFATACPNPRYGPICEALVSDCQRRGKPPDFTPSACVEVLSGIAGEGDRAWAQEAMGPDYEGGRGGCKLTFPLY